MTNPAHCSPARPWGVHAAIRDDHCTRCGWIAREPEAPPIADGDPPGPLPRDPHGPSGLHPLIPEL